MVSIRRPASASDARDAFNEARDALRADDPNFTTVCEDAPVLYTEVRYDEKEAAEMCGRGTPQECPLLAVCEPLGYTESVYADDFVYGGIPWRRGKPVVSETTPESLAVKQARRKERYK